MVIGLGNPGERYEGTRHNVGFILLDCLVDQSGWYKGRTPKVAYSQGSISGSAVLFVKPLTYMNQSGAVVPYLRAKYDISDTVVVHDDIDLPLGAVRISRGRGSGGHNGVQSISEAVDGEIIRIRIGIAATDAEGRVRKPKGGIFKSKRTATSQYVLGKFSAGEQSGLERALEDATHALSLVCAGSVTEAMNQYNKKTTR